MRETLVLWDVDHTLIENDGISKETYQGAFEQVVGRPPSMRPVTHGRTDLQIMREMLVANVSLRRRSDLSRSLGTYCGR